MNKQGTNINIGGESKGPQRPQKGTEFFVIGAVPVSDLKRL